MKIVFCKTAYMRFYNGDESDIESSASFVTENGTGGEIYNFRVFDDDDVKKCRGFIELDGHNINVGRLGGIESVKDVLVVWCAVSKKRWVVVGWYDNAVVYRRMQKTGGHEYYIEADAGNCVLLPEGTRFNGEWKAPRAKADGFGLGDKAPLWYPKYRTDEENNFVNSVVEKIQNYNGANMILYNL